MILENVSYLVQFWISNWNWNITDIAKQLRLELELHLAFQSDYDRYATRLELELQSDYDKYATRLELGSKNMQRDWHCILEFDK